MLHHCFFLCCFMLLFSHTLFSQRLVVQPRQLQGWVQDGESFQPVSFAHVLIGNTGTETDAEGRFIIEANPGDTLRITHVSYQTFVLAVQENMRDSLLITLQPRAHMLREVDIFGLPTEEAFKQEILQLRIAPSMEEEHAKQNILYARQLFLLDVTPEMNSLDNYLWYQNRPQGVSLFSTNPSRGLSRALKQISRSKQFSQLIRMNSSRPDEKINFYRLLQAKDTTAIDTAHVE